MTLFKRCIIPSLLLLTATTTAYGQELSDKAVNEYQPKMLVYENLHNSSVLKKFEHRFGELDNLLGNLVTVSTPLAKLTTPQNVNAALDSLYASKTAHEVMALRRHHGLEVTGQVYGRLDNALHLNDDEDEAESEYKAKFQAELGWNIINSKFYQRKAKEQQLFLANEVKRLQEYRKENVLVYDEMAYRLTDEYNYYIAIVMMHRLQNVDLLNEAHQYMLEQDRIATDKMLSIMNEKMELEYQLSQTYNAKALAESPLYVLEATELLVDTTALYDAIFKDNITMRILKAETDAIDTKSRLTNYLSTTRISPFARWSSYLGSMNQFSQNIDLGVRFTFPLWNETSRRRKAFDTEKSILELNYANENQKVKSFCDLRLNRIKQLNRAITTEHSHIIQLGKYIGVRRNAYTKQSSGYNYIARMEEYNEYLRSMERMYRLMLQRTLTLMEIQKQTGLGDIRTLTVEKKLK